MGESVDIERVATPGLPDILGIEEGAIKDILTSEDFNPRSYYVLTRNPEVYHRLEKFLPLRGFDIITYADGIYAVQEVRGDGFFSDISLGFEPKAFELAERHDLKVILSSKDLTRKSLEEVKLLAETFNDRDILAFMPRDNKFPKEPETRQALLDSLKHHQILLGFDEFASLDGLDEAIRKLDYSVVRVYNRPPHKFMEEYLLAVRDRKDRVVNLHPFLSGQEDLVAFNAQHISEIREIIAQKSLGEPFTLGGLEPFEPYFLGNIWCFVAALGTLWGVWKFATHLGFGKALSLTLVSLVLVGFSALALWNFQLFRDAAGFLVAVTFPVLGIYLEMIRPWEGKSRRWGQVLKGGIASSLRATAITLLGVLILVGIFGNFEALLGVAKFRGIKALYIAAYAALIFLYLWDIKAGGSLRKPVLSLGGILSIGVMSAALFVLITRSGNNSIIPIPQWELAFRSWLENAFWVRPRTKEFLIGFPALMLAGGLKAMGNNRFAHWSYLAALSGTLSMMNTFSHFHIATLVSWVRSAEGVFLGMALGAVALGGVYLYEKREKDNV